MTQLEVEIENAVFFMKKVFFKTKKNKKREKSLLYKKKSRFFFAKMIKRNLEKMQKLSSYENNEKKTIYKPRRMGLLIQKDDLVREIC